MTVRGCPDVSHRVALVESCAEINYGWPDWNDEPSAQLFAHAARHDTQWKPRYVLDLASGRYYIVVE